MSSRQTPGEVSKLRRTGIGAAGVLVFIALWELASRTGLIPQHIAPAASQAGAELLNLAMTARFWEAVGDTLIAWAIGTVIVSAIAVAVGLVLGANPRLWAWLRSTVEALRPIPPIVLLPLAILVLGANRQFTTVMIAQGVFWLLLIQVFYASNDITPVATDTAKVFRIGPARRYFMIRLPAALPVMATALRLGAAIALAVEIMSELIGGVPGVGQLLISAQAGNDLPLIYAITAFIGILGLAVATGLRALEHLALRTHGPVES